MWGPYLSKLSLTVAASDENLYNLHKLFPPDEANGKILLSFL